MVSKSLLLTTNNKLMMIMVEQIKGRLSYICDSENPSLCDQTNRP